MSTPHDPDQYRFHLGWSASARLSAANRVRAVVQEEDGLLPTSEALAEAFLQLFSAESCTVSLLDDGGYHDVVNVGKLAPNDRRFPDPAYRYPLEQFPLSTKLLLAGTGYLSVDTGSALYKEFQGMWPQMPAGSFMGVPIVARGTVRGEIYLARNVSQPGFTGEDLDLAKDLATTFGSALPGLLRYE